jgi:hypothetical protein
VGGARFFASVQIGPGAHPPSYSMGTGSFPGVQRPGRGVDHPPTSRAEIKVRVEPLLPLWAFVACSRLNLIFTYLSSHIYLYYKGLRQNNKGMTTVGAGRLISALFIRKFTGLFLSVERSSLQFFVVLFGPSKQILRRTSVCNTSDFLHILPVHYLLLTPQLKFGI